MSDRMLGIKKCCKNMQHAIGKWGGVWILFLIIALITISYYYYDIAVTTRHGINLWTALFQGRLFDFYMDNTQAVAGAIGISGALYDITIYVVFAIWNFPLWILETVFGVDIFANVFCLIYSKCILILFTAVAAKILVDIAKELEFGEEAIRWIEFTFLSAPILFSSVFLIGQYDIIGLCFMLKGLLSYLRGEKKKFIIWFSVAATFKLFALLIFIPLLLLQEKRVLHIMKNMILVMFPAVVCKLLFVKPKISGPLGEGQTGLISLKVFRNTLQMSFGDTLWFVMGMLAVFIFCYWKKTATHKELRKYAVYMSFLSLAVFFITIDAHPYWLVLLVPFLILVLFSNQKDLKLNLLLETLMSGSLIVAQMIRFSFCYNSEVLRFMIWPALFKKWEELPFILNINEVIKGVFVWDEEVTKSIFLSIFVICLIAIAVINVPGRIREKEQESGNFKIEKSVVWFRLAVGTGLCLAQVLLYFVSVAAYDSVFVRNVLAMFYG